MHIDAIAHSVLMVDSYVGGERLKAVSQFSPFGTSDCSLQVFDFGILVSHSRHEVAVLHANYRAKLLILFDHHLRICAIFRRQRSSKISSVLLFLPTGLAKRPLKYDNGCYNLNYAHTPASPGVAD